MANNVFFKGILLENFRCYDVIEIGPLSKFTLIYGRNGAGKSSLVEAIEVAITGTSSRIQRNQEANDAISRRDGVQFRVMLKKGDIVVSSYDSGKPFRAKSALKRIYNIDAQGKKAKKLLSDMFETHNLLYAEKVVEYLKSDKKNQLESVLSESIVGRETISEWERIEKSREVVKSLIKRYESVNKSIRGELDNLQKQLGSLGEKDLQAIVNHWEKTKKLLLPSFIPQEPARKELLKTTFLRDLRESLERIRETQRMSNEAEEIFEEIQGISGMTFSDLTSEDKRREQEIKRLIQKKKDKQTIFDNIDDEVRGKEHQLDDRLQETINLNSHRVKLENLTENIDLVCHWLPEIATARKSIEQERQIGALKNREGKIVNATKLVKRLAKTGEIAGQTKKQKARTGRLEKIKVKLKKIYSDIEEKEGQLADVVQRMSTLQSREQRMRQIISLIHSQLEEFVEGRPSPKCPACGHKYKTVDDLKLAFQKTAQKIVNEMSVEIDEEIVKQKPVLEKEIAALKEQKSSSLLTEEKIEIQLAVSQEFLDKLISQVRDASAIIRAAGFSIELSEDMTPEDQAAKLVSIPLNETLEEVRKAKTLLIEENHKTWNGLRREQYLEGKQLIEETLTSLKEKLEDMGFQFPTELSEPEWLKLQKGTKKIQDTTVQKLKDAELKAEKNRKEIANLKDKLQKAQKDFERISQNLATEKAYKEKLGILVSRIKLLIEWGLLPTDKVIDLSAIKKQLAEGAIALETFEKSISQHLEDDKLKTDLERRIKLAHSKQDNLDKQRKKLKGFEKNLRKAKNPNERATQVWQQHETTINNFFATLHWPRDFKDVRLENDKGLELTVSSVTAPEDRHPAHLRLSAGQRSALAISVFWTLNTAFLSIPDIILMDEPVQNIDELNILNFLDGLRWFVETTNKQVFLTTASQRIQALARKKFAYLKDDFIEVRLRRESGCSQVKYFDWRDKEVLFKEQEVSRAV